jgi:hypothetical protein
MNDATAERDKWEGAAFAHYSDVAVLENELADNNSGEQSAMLAGIYACCFLNYFFFYGTRCHCNLPHFISNITPL